MLFSFLRLFIGHIINNKTRQRLLILALVGLFLSSFALIFVHGVMGGLQKSLIGRSKSVMGHGVIYLKDANTAADIKKIKQYLHEKKIVYSVELESELLLRQGNYLTPIILHGISSQDFMPAFLNKQNLKEGIVLPLDLAFKIKAGPLDYVQVVSPDNHLHSMMDVPRHQNIEVSKLISTNIPEVDTYHGWVRLPFLQNLLHKKEFNRFRLYLGDMPSVLASTKIDQCREFITNNFSSKQMLFRSWEQENFQLVWSLRLETTIMTMLFVMMSILVSLSITSGLMIFLDKIKVDLVSFWIMGASKKKLYYNLFFTVNFINILAVVSGLCMGIISLLLVDSTSEIFMPSYFVERKIPVNINLEGIMLSLGIPLLISFIFVFWVMLQFGRENKQLEIIRMT